MLRCARFVGRLWRSRGPHHARSFAPELFHPGSPPANDCPDPGPASPRAREYFDGSGVADAGACPNSHARTCMQAEPQYRSFKATDEGACCAACVSDARCATWTLNHAQQQCHLHEGKSDTNAGDCTTGYVRAPLPGETGCPSWSTNFSTAAPANVTLDNHLVTSCGGADGTSAECQFRFVNPDAQIFDGCLKQVVGGKQYDPLSCAMPADNCTDKWLADATTTLLGEVAGAADASGEPFFMMAGFHKPHPFWAIPQEYLDMYTDMALPTHVLAPEGMPEVAYYSCDSIQTRTDVGGPNCADPTLNPQGCHYIEPNATLPTPTMRHIRAAYAGGVTWMDSQVGRLLQHLDDIGHANDTITVFFADHGWGLGEHGLYCKMANFELETRVPLMIRVPWLPDTANTTSTALVELLDVYPTLAELTGLSGAVHDALDGDSLVPLLTRGGGAEPDYRGDPAFNASFSQYPRCVNTSFAKEPPFLGERDPCIQVPSYEFTHMGVTMRTAEWRYTEWPRWNTTTYDWTHVDGVELYAHAGDDGSCFDCYENVNVAAQPQHAALLRQFSALLRAHVASRTAPRPQAGLAADLNA